MVNRQLRVSPGLDATKAFDPAPLFAGAGERIVVEAAAGLTAPLETHTKFVGLLHKSIAEALDDKGLTMVWKVKVHASCLRDVKGTQAWSGTEAKFVEYTTAASEPKIRRWVRSGAVVGKETHDELIRAMLQRRFGSDQKAGKNPIPGLCRYAFALKGGAVDAQDAAERLHEPLALAEHRHGPTGLHLHDPDPARVRGRLVLRDGVGDHLAEVDRRRRDRQGAGEDVGDVLHVADELPQLMRRALQGVGRAPVLRPEPVLEVAGDQAYAHQRVADVVRDHRQHLRLALAQEGRRARGDLAVEQRVDGERAGTVARGLSCEPREHGAAQAAEVVREAGEVGVALGPLHAERRGRDRYAERLGLLERRDELVEDRPGPLEGGDEVRPVATESSRSVRARRRCEGVASHRQCA